MQAYSYLSSSSCIAIANLNHTLFPARLGRQRVACDTTKVAVSSSGEANNRDFKGKLVDENMIILRMRIKDMKMMEDNGSHGCVETENWMEWEKRYYCKHYHEDVCAGIGWLQMYLMNTRPILALGMMALIAFSVPISTFLVICNVFQIVKKGFLS